MIFVLMRRRYEFHVAVPGAMIDCTPRWSRIASAANRELAIPITFSNGRPFNAREFTDKLMRKALETAQEAMLEKFHGLASSMIDPVTGKHPLTFAWLAPQGMRILTTGSEAFALLLDRRLTGDENYTSKAVMEPKTEVVYFAHAWEDKAVARPIAEYLTSQGIETWFDEWEMRSGDSLRQKMDDGLGVCSHFIVLLTKISLTKPWVNAEIDAGFGKRIEGSAKFIPIRYDLSVSALPPLMRFIVTPEIDPTILTTLQSLVSDIHGISLKPALGLKPRYVQRTGAHPQYSQGACAVAEVIVKASKAAEFLDPQISRDELVTRTGMTEVDVEIGTHDLVKAGLLEQSETIGSTVVWPLGPLFVTFDESIMGWSPAADARTLAAAMVNGGKEQWDTKELQDLIGWPDRRMNAALHAVAASKLAITRNFNPSPLALGGLLVTVETKRAAREA